ncbi:MAG: class I SAM-dependent methyltransferase [Acidobacteria bacterium]|nr:class I SAM-dependent methyltransferase [Acidobacteriota bacterium]
MDESQLISLLSSAITARIELFDNRHERALRLFNGFFEGYPSLVIDLYARTVLLHNYADSPDLIHPLLKAVEQYLINQFPWVNTIVLKTRNTESLDAKKGIIIKGEKPDSRICEHGVWYAIDLLLNQDASFYLDTYNLRSWIINNLREKTVLNTFAYTCSLGVAAQKAGAKRVVNLDLNRNFLNVGKTSYTLNGFPINKADFQSGDFWTQISHFKKTGETFDVVIVDPPFFAISNKGKIDLVNESHRIINKVRPLINNDGYLIAINNALFVSGADYYKSLEALCSDGYLSIEELISIPDDFIGYKQTQIKPQMVDPTPFNHSTKIAIIKVRRKLNSTKVSQ